MHDKGYKGFTAPASIERHPGRVGSVHPAVDIIQRAEAVIKAGNDVIAQAQAAQVALARARAYVWVAGAAGVLAGFLLALVVGPLL